MCGGGGGGGDRLQTGPGAPQPWVPRLRRSSSRRASTKPKIQNPCATGAHGALERRARPHGAHAPATTSRVLCRDPRARRGLAAACVRSLRGSTARRRLGRKATSCKAPALQQPLRRRRNRYAPSYAYVARTRRSRRSASPGRGACRLARVKVLLCPISSRSSPARASRPGFVRCAMTQYYVRAHAAAATAAPRTRVVVRCCAPPWTGPSCSSLWVFVGRAKKIGWLILGN